ncbi:D-alanyl-D-alanine carboxypeptidase family protein [Gryllotalpicola reticulitermitis]|uniref:D-alanyl-D-alanine carboxypeptidase family protein n=1 Tax=Gryllotalpicola reticulitermitis TaxID=1184153 RepID=A0ABV8QA34_9MICO
MSLAVDLEPERPTQAAKPPRRRRRAGRRAAVIIALVLVLAMAAYVGLALVRPLPATAAIVPASATASIETAGVAPAWPATGGAAIGLVGQDELLGSHGSDASVPIASMTKTITALVLLDRYKLTAGEQGPTITFGERDVDILNEVWAEDGSWAKVAAGEKLTLVQALTAMILPSANNYARSLAVWSYGSQAKFVSVANAWLKQHGFTHTHMTDPSGLDSGSVSNMTDLVGIGKLAIANPVLAKVVNTPTATLPTVGTIHNTDPLIGKYGIEGVKTGYTQQAGHCLLFAAKVSVNGTERTFVGVMTGQPTYAALWKGVPKLLKSFEQSFHLVDLTNSGTTVYASYRAPWGAKTSVIPGTTPHVELYSKGSVTVKVDAARLVTAPSGAAAGKVTFTAAGTGGGGDTTGTEVSAPLVTTGTLAAPSAWWRITHPHELF